MAYYALIIGDAEAVIGRRVLRQAPDSPPSNWVEVPEALYSRGGSLGVIPGTSIHDRRWVDGAIVRVDDPRPQASWGVTEVVKAPRDRVTVQLTLTTRADLTINEDLMGQAYMIEFVNGEADVEIPLIRERVSRFVLNRMAGVNLTNALRVDLIF